MNIEELKDEADILGVSYTYNIKFETLQKKVDEHIAMNDALPDIVDGELEFINSSTDNVFTSKGVLRPGQKMMLTEDESLELKGIEIC